ncbi:hypothetical protein [Streptomyces sp. NPDC007205]|uniref:hypothetical protein n=1 Tax=Streptomyces sp. NPDC007205 TaxID=3154316 RepID=UPI0033E5E991
MRAASSASSSPHYGKTARGYNDPLFTSQWGFAPAAKYDSAGLLAKGATMVVNATRRPERILTPQQNELFERLVNSGRDTGGSVVIEAVMLVRLLPKPASGQIEVDEHYVSVPLLMQYSEGPGWRVLNFVSEQIPVPGWPRSGGRAGDRDVARRSGRRDSLAGPLPFRPSAEW